MTLAGWIILFISIGMISFLFGWCLYKVFSFPGENRHGDGAETKPYDS